MKEDVFTHDHLNTWQVCKNRYYFKYIKKLNWPDFAGDYELGRNFHALIDYHLRGFDIQIVLKDASEEVKQCWELIKDNSILDNKLVKTEWGFNTRIADSTNWLAGRIDAVFYDPKKSKYIIADWKTGKYIPKKIDPNFQHKIYLYALYNSRKDLGLEFKPEKLEFQYIKIQDKVSVSNIEFSEDKNAEYEEKFLSIIREIKKTEDFNAPPACPLKPCVYKNLCFK